MLDPALVLALAAHAEKLQRIATISQRLNELRTEVPRLEQELTQLVRAVSPTMRTLEKALTAGGAE